MLLALPACGTVSSGQVGQFGSASASLAADARRAFELAAETSVERNLYDVAGDPNRGPTDATFEGLFTGDVGMPGGREKAARLALRVQILDQLSSYASALQQLADADVTEDIDEAARKLNGALVGLGRTFEKAAGKSLPIRDADLGAIATAVNAIGKTVAEVKRRAAIRTAIEKADPAVQAATALVAADLGSESELAAFVRQAISNSRGSLQQAYNLQRVRPGSTFDERFEMLARIRQLYEAEINSPAFFAAVSDGTRAVGAAHAALKQAVDDGDFSSAEVAKRIGELEVHAKSVRDFHKSLRPRG
jgi:hypothetical protein